MNAEDQIRNLKQIPPLSKEEKRNKLKSSIVLMVATTISILFLVYAFMQKQEADRLKALSKQSMVEAQYQRALAEEQRTLAEAARAEAELQRSLAVEALKNCERNNR